MLKIKNFYLLKKIPGMQSVESKKFEKISKMLFWLGLPILLPKYGHCLVRHNFFAVNLKCASSCYVDVAYLSSFLGMALVL